MNNCKNCFSQVNDLRKETHCSMCNEPLHKDCAIKDGGTFFCDVCYTVKEEDSGNLFDESIIIPEVIRRSYIETYKSCPYKFYMEVIKGIEAPINPYAQVGIDMHELFDKACNDKDFKYKQMLDEFNKVWYNYNPTMFSDEQQKLMLYNRSLSCIKNFYEVLPTLPPQPHSTEETIEFNIGDDLPKIQTTSDRIDLVDEELELIDWKTGKVMVGQRLSSDLQVPLYIYGVRDKYKLPVRKFTLYYLEDNKTRVFERITNEDYVCRVRKREYFVNITDAIREVQKLFSQIKKGNFNIPRDTSKIYFTCKMCHLQTQGICKGADIESWKQYNKQGG